MTKTFDISDVLSVTDGRLVSTRHMDGVYDILNFMTGESLFTHALIRAVETCRPSLLAQFPQLSNDANPEFDGEEWQTWIAGMRAKHGDAFDVEPLASYESLHPLDEPILAGKKIIAVVQP